MPKSHAQTKEGELSAHQQHYGATETTEMPPLKVTHINGVPCNVDMKTNLVMTFVMSIYFCNFKVWMSFGGYIIDYFGISFSLLTFIFVLAKLGRVSMMPVSRWFGRIRINRFLCINLIIGSLMLFLQQWFVVDDYVYNENGQRNSVNHNTISSNNSSSSKQTLFGKIIICLTRTVYITLLFAISAQYQSCLKSATQGDQKRFQELNSLFNSAFTIGTLLFFPTGFILKHLGFVWFLRGSSIITFSCGISLLFLAPPVATDEVCSEIKLRQSQMNLNHNNTNHTHTRPAGSSDISSREDSALLRTDVSNDDSNNNGIIQSSSSLKSDLMDMLNDEARMSVLIPGCFVAWSWGVFYTVFGPFIKEQFELQPQILGTVLTLSEGIGQIFALLSFNFLFQSTILPSKVGFMIGLGSFLEVCAFVICYLFIKQSVWFSGLGCLVFFTGHEALFLSMLTCLQNYTSMESMAFTISVYFIVSYTLTIGFGQILVSFLFGNVVGIYPTLLACIVSSSIGGLFIVRMDRLAKQRERKAMRMKRRIKLMDSVFVDESYPKDSSQNIP